MRRGRHRRWGPGGGPGRGRFFNRGEMRLALLTLIVEEPRHGYDLMRELESRSAGAYRPSAGAVYPTLQQLQDEGLVTSSSDGSKTIYTATEEGRAEAQREHAAVDAIWDRASEWGSWSAAGEPAALEIARHVEGLVKAAFNAVARGGADPDRVRAILQQARDDIDALASR